MTLTESFGGKLAVAISLLARLPTPSVDAERAMEDVICHEVHVGLAGEESLQALVDQLCRRGVDVTDVDPDSWEACGIITLVHDGVVSVVCVNDLGAVWLGHVWHTVVCRCCIVHAIARSLTEAREFTAIAIWRLSHL